MRSTDAPKSRRGETREPAIDHGNSLTLAARGDLKHYQCWYRDAATFCTTSTFNLSNGLSLTWGP